jgi:hypothetical protein
MGMIASFFVPVKGGGTGRQGFAKVAMSSDKPLPKMGKRLFCEALI